MSSSYQTPGEERFELSRGWFRILQDCGTEESAGVLFRWSGTWTNLGYEALWTAGFREAVTSALNRDPSLASGVRLLRDGARVEFLGSDVERVDQLWQHLRARLDVPLGSVTRKKSKAAATPRIAVSAPSVSVKHHLQLLDDAVRRLGVGEQAVVPEYDVLLSGKGWALHVQRLADTIGWQLSPDESLEIQETFGSLAEALVALPALNSSECPRTVQRLWEVRSVASSMRVQESDEALLAIMAKHRRSWPLRSKLKTAGEGQADDWAIVSDRALLLWMRPGKQYRRAAGKSAEAYLAPLAGLSRISYKEKRVPWERPLLGEVGRMGSGMPPVNKFAEEFRRSFLGEDEQAFYVKFGPALRETAIPTFQPVTGPSVWGHGAVRAAKMEAGQAQKDDSFAVDAEDAAAEVARVERLWRRSQGYSFYYDSLSRVGRGAGWRLSCRRLARALFSNLHSGPKAPLWANSIPGPQLFREPYYGRNCTDMPGVPDGRYFLALGSRKYSYWRVRTWMDAANFGQSRKACTAFLDDVEILHNDLGIEWNVNGVGGGSKGLGALKDLLSAPTQFGEVRVQFLVPSCLLDDEEGGWTSFLEWPIDAAAEVDAHQLATMLGKTKMLQKDFATAMNLQPSTVSRWLNGTRPIPRGRQDEMRQFFAEKEARLPLNQGKSAQVAKNAKEISGVRI